MASSDEWAFARRRVGLLDRRDFGVLELTGRDRATFLHALLSNEIKALAPGQGCAATLLDVHGKVQVVVSVWVADDRIFLVTPPAMAEKVAEALDHYLFSEKVVIRDASPETALFVLVGPEARGKGYGAGLSQAIEDECRRRGYKKVVTTIYVTNLPMIFIKLKQGYYFEGFHRDHDRPGLHEYTLGKIFADELKKP